MSPVARTRAQVFVELRAEDPEAVSAFAVARERLAAGRGLRALRRWRVFELTGALPAREELEALLHGSIQFYNPAKERVHVRVHEADPTPAAAGESLVLVLERGGERRPGAERWWRHETGARIEVREAVAWGLRFEPGEDVAARTAELAVTRDRAHGLLANPHVQDARVRTDAPPLDWLSRREGRTRSRTRRTP